MKRLYAMIADIEMTEMYRGRNGVIIYTVKLIGRTPIVPCDLGLWDGHLLIYHRPSILVAGQ